MCSYDGYIEHPVCVLCNVNQHMKVICQTLGCDQTGALGPSALAQKGLVEGIQTGGGFTTVAEEPSPLLTLGHSLPSGWATGEHYCLQWQQMCALPKAGRRGTLPSKSKWLSSGSCREIMDQELSGGLLVSLRTCSCLLMTPGVALALHWYLSIC